MPRLRKADAAIGEGPAVLVAGAEARRASRRQAGLTRETKPNTEYSGFGLLQAEPAAGNTSLFAPRILTYVIPMPQHIVSIWLLNICPAPIYRRPDICQEARGAKGLVGGASPRK